jgi:hypothetical protein
MNVPKCVQSLFIAGCSLWTLLAAVGCDSKAEPTWDAVAKTKVTLEVSTMLHDYHAAIRKGGLLAEFAFLDSSADFFWVPPGYAAPLDYATMRKIVTDNATKVDTISSNWEMLEIHPLTMDIATFVGKLSVFTIANGDTSRSSLLESGTLIRRKDGWKLLSGQTANSPQ